MISVIYTLQKASLLKKCIPKILMIVKSCSMKSQGRREQLQNVVTIMKSPRLQVEITERSPKTSTNFALQGTCSRYRSPWEKILFFIRRKHLEMVKRVKVTPTTFYEISKISHICSIFRKSVCIRVVNIF